MSKVIPITSQSHFKTTLASTSYLVVDFYADWCGPCKTISPVFEQLATQQASPGRLTFCKVNVDNQRDVAATYGISAMPTFLVLKGSTVVESIRGANATALRTAILSAAASAATGPARSGPAFSGKGQTLGGSEGAGSAAPRRTGTAMPNMGNLGAMASGPAAFAQGSGALQTVVRFLGLYFTTLFSLEPARAAEESPFAVKRPAGQRVGR